MTPRRPFFVLSGAVGCALLVASLEGERPTMVPAPGALPRLEASVASGEAAASTWYCAAGTAADGGVADHTVVVSNPTDQEVSGLLTVYPGEMHGATTAAAAKPATAPPLEHRFTVPAHDRAEFKLDKLQSAPLAAALVEVDSGAIAVEHQLWGPLGRDVAACASAAASSWHFAWGSTARDARELLVLFNPFPSDVTVDASFSTEAGVREPVRWQGLTIPARSVVGVDVGDDVTRRGQVAASVRARGGRLVVDRVQLFDGSVGPKGLSVALGQPGGAEQWLFAHGRVDDATGERVILYNPGTRDAEVDVSLHGAGDGQAPIAPFGVVVRPGDVEIVDYAAEDRVARQVQHATAVHSRNGVPIVAERVLSFDRGVLGGPGSRFAATRWAFPVADAGEGRAVRFAVVNPDAGRATRVSLTLHAAGVQTRPDALHAVEVPAGGRVELVVEDLTAGRASVVADSPRPVVVERIVAQDQRDVAVGPGVPLP